MLNYTDYEVARLRQLDRVREAERERLGRSLRRKQSAATRLRIRMTRRRLHVLASALAVAAAIAAPVAAAASQRAVTPTVVATGLDSPRALAITAAGALLVAEAGHGGDVCGKGGLCIGTTSRISRVDTATGSATPLVTGLFSENVPEGGVTGVDGLSAAGGRLIAAITGAPQFFAQASCANQPADCETVLAAAKAQAGQLMRFTSAGTSNALAGVGASDFDLTAHDASLSGEGPNANPYGVLTLPSGIWVADAGANLLDFVSADKSIHVSARIPKNTAGGFPGDGVPTCLAIMRGNLYAADLAGRVWERRRSFTPTQVPVVDASGTPLLHHVTGCVSDGLDHLYLVNMWGTPGPPIPAGPQSVAGTGSVVELARNGRARVLAGSLDFPNGIAIAKDGSLYVTVGSTCTAVGTPFPYCAKGGGIIRIARP
jgi:hypothetical protein